MTSAPGPVPTITAGQMREVDRVVIEEYGIDLVRMMENAGRALAELAITRFDPASVTVLAGAGGSAMALASAGGSGPNRERISA